MKKTLSMTAALLALTVGLASAAGLNLNWTNCALDAGTANRNFACTNSGFHHLIASFVAPAGMVSVTGIEIGVDMQTTGGTFATWWDPACRVTTPPAVDFSADFAANPGGGCDYYFSGTSGGGFVVVGFGGVDRAQLRASFARTSGFGPIAADAEVYATRISLNSAGTVGSPCGGCSEGACIVLNKVLVTQDPNLNADVLMSTPADRAHVTWQGGGGIDCPAATPAKRATWGMIKSLYR